MNPPRDRCTRTFSKTLEITSLNGTTYQSEPIKFEPNTFHADRIFWTLSLRTGMRIQLSIQSLELRLQLHKLSMPKALKR